ncbi:hypothetical protein [Alkalihalobacillus sp. 1P02AB]|uniref:hypothetical protein n=1 Tax=Alkalihalobacillus sp. 1P02AB TaxID=3132260 RepID=UPI0039A4BA3C
MEFALFGIFSLLLSLAVPVFVVVVTVLVLKSFKERNELLRDIRDELRNKKSY